MSLDEFHRAALERIVAGESQASVHYHYTHDVTGIYELRIGRDGEPYITWMELNDNPRWRRSHAATNYYLERKRHILTHPTRCPCCGQEV